MTQTAIDSGREFYRWLTSQRGLVRLLQNLEDEDGKKTTQIHRNVSPELEEFAIQCVEAEQLLDPEGIADFLVFQLRDEFREQCMSCTDATKPESVQLDVQIASTCLKRATRIKQQFEAAISRLDGCCQNLTPCQRIQPQPMGCLKVGVAIVRGASEEHEPISAAREFGLQVFDLDVELTIRS